MVKELLVMCWLAGEARSNEKMERNRLKSIETVYMEPLLWPIEMVYSGMVRMIDFSWVVVRLPAEAAAAFLFLLPLFPTVLVRNQTNKEGLGVKKIPAIQWPP
jgi:hypothetical protein